jgi:ATP-dependent Lon protease
MFIATANVLDSIPPALRDRMEIIQLAGYSSEEKIKIANKYLVPKQTKENGITVNDIKMADKTLYDVIRSYTRESGLRNLERIIGKICRKIAKGIAEGKEAPKAITSKLVEKFLGPATYLAEELLQNDEIGTATGLAWTQFGGEILSIEVASAPGNGLKLTGNLGDVMKESAMTALSYVKTTAEYYGIKESVFKDREIHIHFPSGAIPKDGPSAGITIATAIISHLTGRAISRFIAMTGEISLTGKVLPIGGLKEKALAAMRAGIKTIIAPSQNEKDLVNIPQEYRKKLDFKFVDRVEQVIEKALLPDRIDGITYLESEREKRLKVAA